MGMLLWKQRMGCSYGSNAVGVLLWKQSHRDVIVLGLGLQMGFTGLVQAIGLATFDATTHLLSTRATLEFWQGCQMGDSIAHNGCCLTLLKTTSSDTAQFFVMEETLKRTNLAQIGTEGIQVNLEKALQQGDRLGGHLVAGHVDETAAVVEVIRNDDTSIDVWIEPSTLKYCVHKGSIALNGVSLTIASIEAPRIRVCVIPHTKSHTNIGQWKAGDRINVEYDQALKRTARDAPLGQQTARDAPPDEKWMRHAMELGMRGRCTSAPNPWVGCVIVSKDGMILGEGWHAQAGTGHAEVRAIEDAALRGYMDLTDATVYVTLEPCNHTGRTPPCTQALLQHKIQRVVVGVMDPDSHVQGQGIQCLRDAGIDVTLGILEKEVTRSLRPYLHHRRTGLPWVVLKFGITLDGKITLPSGAWITSPESQDDVHRRWRATSQAIMVGVRTAYVDRPQLTVRQWPSDTDPSCIKPPLRVVVGDYIPTHALADDTATTIVFNTEGPGIRIPERDGHVDLRVVLKELGQRGCLQILVEGGAQLATSFLADGLANQLVLYQSPILSGPEGIPWYCGSCANGWRLDAFRALGGDLCLEYERRS